MSNQAVREPVPRLLSPRPLLLHAALAVAFLILIPMAVALSGFDDVRSAWQPWYRWHHGSIWTWLLLPTLGLAIVAIVRINQRTAALSAALGLCGAFGVLDLLGYNLWLMPAHVVLIGTFLMGITVGRENQVVGSVMIAVGGFWAIEWWAGGLGSWDQPRPMVSFGVAVLTVGVCGAALLRIAGFDRERPRLLLAPSIAGGLSLFALVVCAFLTPALWLFVVVTAVAVLTVFVHFTVALVRRQLVAAAEPERTAGSLVGHTAEGVPLYGGAIGVSQRTNSFATAALVLGLLLGPLAIPFGHIALVQIRRTGENGKGLAIAGLVLGYLALLAWLVAAVVLVVLYLSV